ncbi:MAG: hypothetical protein H0T47_05160 [Planctomycetaceae bacterium]|nr:hypothetical protein [Planctomycetaceae bacterium]
MAGLAGGAAVAQEPAGETAEEAPLSSAPVAVVNVASVERVLEDVTYLFGSVDRKDMSDVVTGLLGNLGDLKGLERGKPFGVMLFLKPGIVPQPLPIGYLPVTDIGSLTRTVELGPVTTKKIAEDRYEIIGQRRTLYARLIGEYAYVSAEDEALDRDFPNPLESFAALTTRYDVAVDVRPENVPPGMRELFLGIVRTQTQAQLQQRDKEPDAAYAFRKSQGMNNLRLVEAFLKETRSLTLGLDTSSQNRKAVLELVVEAVPDTPFLESLQGLADEPSRFAPLLDDEVPLSFSMNSKLDDYSKKAQTELLNAGELQLAKILTTLEREDSLGASTAEDGSAPLDEEPDPVATALAERIFAPLKKVVEGGNIDAFAQFRGDPEKKFVVIGGLEVPGAAGMETAVRELIDRVRSAKPEIEAAVDVQYGVAEVGGVSLHRIAPREIREERNRLFGDQLAFYVGFDSNAIWLAVGGPPAVPALDEAVTRSKDAGLAERNRPPAPFQLVVTANRWVGMDPNGKNTEMAREAFSEGEDTLRIDFRPTDKGGRLRIEAEDGFIRLLGLGVSRRYDESQL